MKYKNKKWHGFKLGWIETKKLRTARDRISLEEQLVMNSQNEDEDERGEYGGYPIDDFA